MHCPRCQHENRPQATFCEACGTPLTANPSGPPAPSYAEVTSALSEAQERETATAEILQVIAGSPTDIRSVFQAMAQSAAQLCGSHDTSIFRLDGEALRLVAHHGSDPRRTDRRVFPPAGPRHRDCWRGGPSMSLTSTLSRTSFPRAASVRGAGATARSLASR
jgi:hypothetical protein